ncbi:polyprenyl synthetase family protein [Streptomyces sp. NPDC048290]|uniref:polyprenyl synthetase family protein n=1 Tax=Streptomyces sp. NPDC048290 TaxID=3155811 RepID=UPI0034237CA1
MAEPVRHAPTADVDAVITADAHLLDADLRDLLAVSAHNVMEPLVPGFAPQNRTLQDAIRLALHAPHTDAFALDHARLRSTGRGGGPAPGVRPSTVYWAFRNYRGFSVEDEAGADFGTVRRIAASVRLLLKAAVIIDDIQDGSETRFGRPALHLTHGVPLALNTASWMITRGLRHMAVPEVVDYALGAVQNGFTGQALDLSTHLTDVKRTLAAGPPADRVEFWTSVAALKTSTLLQLPLNTAAFALDIPRDERTVLDESMHLMGLGAQLLNDLLDFLPHHSAANSFTDFKGLKNRVCLELLGMSTPPSRAADDMTPEELKSFALDHPGLPDVMLRLADDAVRFKRTAKERVFALCRSKESAAYFDAAIERVGHHIDLVAEELHTATSLDALLVPTAAG